MIIHLISFVTGYFQVIGDEKKQHSGTTGSGSPAKTCYNIFFIKSEHFHEIL
jgi:hypothetical protein